MNDHLDKDYIDERVLKLIIPIGYKLRCSNYYIIEENDGYINISSYIDEYSTEVICFHKNFYQTEPCTHKDLEQQFLKFEDFENFIELYHQKTCRRLKIEKLNNIEI